MDPIVVSTSGAVGSAAPMNQHFRPLWQTVKGSSTYGSAAVVPPPPPGFERAYHITSVEYGISNIALGRVKVARFSDLNDPFELMAVNFREAKMRQAVGDFKASYDKRTGLLCFSKDWINPLLWSHYGAKHRGMCLGFDIPTPLLEEVAYETERLKANLEPHGDPEQLSLDLQKTLMRTKSHDWKYEQEVRQFVQLDKAVPEGALHFLPFSDNLRLVEVILGTNCAHPLPMVRAFVSGRYPEVTTFQARLAHKWFSVVPVEESVLPRA